jgi:hypothetical protein
MVGTVVVVHDSSVRCICSLRVDDRRDRGAADNTNGVNRYSMDDLASVVSARSLGRGRRDEV